MKQVRNSENKIKTKNKELDSMDVCVIGLIVCIL